MLLNEMQSQQKRQRQAIEKILRNKRGDHRSALEENVPGALLNDPSQSDVPEAEDNPPPDHPESPGAQDPQYCIDLMKALERVRDEISELAHEEYDLDSEIVNLEKERESISSAFDSVPLPDINFPDKPQKKRSFGRRPGKGIGYALDGFDIGNSLATAVERARRVKEIDERIAQCRKRLGEIDLIEPVKIQEEQNLVEEITLGCGWD